MDGCNQWELHNFDLCFLVEHNYIGYVKQVSENNCQIEQLVHMHVDKIWQVDYEEQNWN